MIIFITFGIKQKFTIISEFIVKILNLLPEYYQFVIFINVIQLFCSYSISIILITKYYISKEYKLINFKMSRIKIIHLYIFLICYP